MPAPDAGPDATVTAGVDFSSQTLRSEGSDLPLASFGRTSYGALPERRAAVRSALKAGAIGILIAAIPFLGIVMTGGLAVYFYRRESGTLPAPAIAARLGAAAGLVVFAANALATILIIVFHAQQECIDSIVEAARKLGIDTASPQFQATIQGLFTPARLAAFFVIAVLLAAIGGALASMLLRTGNRRN